MLSIPYIDYSNTPRMFQSMADDEAGKQPEWLNIRGLGETQQNPLIRWTAPKETWNQGAHYNPNLSAMSGFGNDTQGKQSFLNNMGGIQPMTGTEQVQSTMPYLQPGHELNPDVLPGVKNTFENIPREDLMKIIEARQPALPEVPPMLQMKQISSGDVGETGEDTTTDTGDDTEDDEDTGGGSGDPRSRADVNLLFDSLLEKLLGVGTYANSPYTAPGGGIGEFLARGR